MSNSRSSIVMAVLATLTSLCVNTTEAWAAEGWSAHSAESEKWVEKMTNPAESGSAFRDPAVFATWMRAMAQPATAHALGKAVMDPAVASRFMVNAMSPAAFQNWAQFANPEVAAKWMTALMNPGFYSGFAQFADPALASHWMGAGMDTKFYAPAMQVANPSFYTQWMTAAMTSASTLATITK